MNKGVLYYYYHILQYSPLIPIVIGIPWFRRLEKPMKLFLVYLLFSLFLTVIMTFLAVRGKNTLWIMNIGSPFYVCFILWTFSLWEMNAKLQRLLRLSIIAFTVVWCVEISVRHLLFGFTTFARPIEDTLFLLAACLAIYQANKNSEILITSQPQFWISSGIVTYFAGVIILNLFSDTLLKLSEQTLRSVIIYIQPALSFSSHILYAEGYRVECRRLKFSG